MRHIVADNNSPDTGVSDDFSCHRASPACILEKQDIILLYPELFARPQNAVLRERLDYFHRQKFPAHLKPSHVLQVMYPLIQGCYALTAFGNPAVQRVYLLIAYPQFLFPFKFPVNPLALSADYFFKLMYPVILQLKFFLEFFLVSLHLPESFLVPAKRFRPM
ncbi:Uncharacterised protein [uncultured archaeon]|nr:Uncharacterised protein [uncultured archaeon]